MEACSMEKVNKNISIAGDDFELYNGESIQCDGLNSCRRATISIEQSWDLFCTARRACQQATIYGEVNSTSKNACRQITISNALSIVCGFDSCISRYFVNVLSNIYGLGKNSLSSSIIRMSDKSYSENNNSTRNLYCLAYSSHDNINISFIDNVYGNGDHALHSSILTSLKLRPYVSTHDALKYSQIYDSNNSINLCNNMSS